MVIWIFYFMSFTYPRMMKPQCIRQYKYKIDRTARRTLHFESASPHKPQNLLPPILINGNRIDISSPTRMGLTNEFLRLKDFSNKTPPLDGSILRESGNISTPILDTPEKQKLLEKGNSKSWVIIGQGSFGTVIRAKYKGEKVAVKIVSKSNNLKKETLIREKNAIKLNHPNIIKIMGVIDFSDTKFGLVVMELWDSIDLQQYLEDCAHCMTFLQKVCCSLDICNALMHCHEKHIIHLDVKPKNVLIHTLGWPSKICDFGNSISTNKMNSQTCCTSQQGTIKYMAPELLKNGAITEKADIYSLGITMWQLLHEEIPYKGEDLHTVIYRVVSQDYRPHSSKFDSLKNEYVRIYEMCWSKSCSSRPSAAQTAESLALIALKSK